jgi:hypothetical protein
MPRNGSGTYSAPASSWNPPVNGTLMDPTDWSALLADIVAAMTASIARDGQTTPTADLPMGGFRVTNLGAGNAANTALTYLQTLAQLTSLSMVGGRLNEAHGADIDSAVAAGTLNLSAATGNVVDVTGTTAVTAVTLPDGGEAIVRFTGILTLTNGASLVLPGGASITTAAGDFAVFRGYAAGVVRCVLYTRASGLPVVNPTIVNLRGYLSGAQMSTAGASTTMSVAAGTAADAGNAVLMELNSALAKTTASWVVGNAAGGLDTGAIANNTWYHFYIIRRPDTGVVDVCCSLSAANPTTGAALPAAYTQYRRIGSGKTNGSGQWQSFTQTGDMFQWLTLADDSAVFAGLTTAAANYVVSVPTGVAVIALVQPFLSRGSNAIGGRFFNPSLTDQAPDSTSNGIANMGSTVVGGTSVRISHDLQVLTNTSAQIRAVTDLAPSAVDFRTRGWIDQRGKN